MSFELLDDFLVLAGLMILLGMIGAAIILFIATIITQEFNR